MEIAYCDCCMCTGLIQFIFITYKVGFVLLLSDGCIYCIIPSMISIALSMIVIVMGLGSTIIHRFLYDVFDYVCCECCNANYQG